MDLSKSVVKVDGENFGTGCVVGPRLVLTALHVVSQQYFENKDCTTLPQAKVAGKPAKLLWPKVPFTKDAIDVALLSVDEDLGPALPVDADWPAGALFRTRGWPASALGPVEPHGQLVRHDEAGLERLDCSAGPQPDEGEDWPGVSGAPVVVAGRVRGVIIHRVPGWRGLLDAVPLSVVLADPAFRALLPAGGHDARLADKIRATLAGDPALAAAMRTAADADQTQLVELLLRGNIEVALEAIATAHQKSVTSTVESKQRHDRELSQALFHLAGMVVACRAPLVEATSWGGFEVVAFTESGIELAAARHGGRAVEFGGVTSEADNPPGRHRIPLGPDKGKIIAAEMEAHVREKLKLGDTDVPASFVNQRLAALRSSMPLYVGGDASRVGDAETTEALRDFQSRYSSLPVLLRKTSTADGAGALEAGVVPILNRIHMVHQTLPPQ